jgi:hypothetical protein
MDKEELLDKYFEKSLTHEEEEVFALLKETDPKFAEELAFRQQVQQAFVLQERKKIKDFLQEVEKDMVSSGQGKQRLLLAAPWYYAAASLALLVGAVYFFWSGTQQNQSPDYLSYYTPYPNVIAPTTRQGEAAEGDMLELAFFAAYERGDYREANRLLENSEKVLAPYLLFYQGIAKFELKAYQEAALLFDLYLQRKDLQFAPQAQWYAALAFLAEGNAEKAKPYLLALQKEKSFKVEETIAILGTLNK